MGTRHLTAVILDGEYKIAQYGQWDGYPEGQGETVIEFLKTWDRPKFEAALRASSFMSKEESEQIGKQIEAEGLQSSWQSRWPYLSRDMGADILQFVQASGGLKLKNSLSFAGDSLFCEFAYVLDLDKNVLEVYRGFNKEPLKQGDRFFGVQGLEKVEDYEPIRLAKAYPLNELPTVEQMTEDVCEKEGTEQAK